MRNLAQDLARQTDLLNRASRSAASLARLASPYRNLVYIDTGGSLYFRLQAEINCAEKLRTSLGL
jgi:hypothetical protein